MIGPSVYEWTAPNHPVGGRAHPVVEAKFPPLDGGVTEAALDKTPRVVDYISGAAMLVRRETIEAIGVLDEAFHLYVEEVDWCRAPRGRPMVFGLCPAAASGIRAAVSVNTIGNRRWRITGFGTGFSSCANTPAGIIGWCSGRICCATFWARALVVLVAGRREHGRALWRACRDGPVPETLARHHPVMPPARASDGDCLICLWACSWHGLRQRHQQIMGRLGRSMRCCMSNRRATCGRSLRSVFRGQMQLRQLFRSREVETGIHVFSRWCRSRCGANPAPEPPLPAAAGLAPPHAHPAGWVSRGRCCGFRIRWPNRSLGRWGKNSPCYDCCDELTDLPPKMARIILDSEERLLRKVAVVFVTSEPLLQSLVRAPKRHLVQTPPMSRISRSAARKPPCPAISPR